MSPYLQRAPVDTENPKLQSKESFTGTAVKLWLPQSQMIKAFIAYSWQAMDRDFDACSKEHGHAVSDHWMQFLPD